MKHIVGFSGGIDSQACARWVLAAFAFPARGDTKMSYRKAWRTVKAVFPEAYCLDMTGWFRIAKDRTPEAVMEFYELGSGATRAIAWQNAAEYISHLERKQHEP